MELHCIEHSFSTPLQNRNNSKNNVAVAPPQIHACHLKLSPVDAMNSLASDGLFLLCASICASIGAISDWRTRRIPNLLTGSAFVLGLLLHLVAGGWRQMAIAAAAGFLSGAAFFLFFIVGGMGGGDVKLMAAVGCIAGFGSLMELFLSIVLIGGLFALALAMLRGRLKSTLSNVGALLFHHGRSGLLQHPELNLLNTETLRLPYGIAIAAGCWITVAGQNFFRVMQ